MILQNNPSKINKPFLKFKGKYLEKVYEYKYLGCVITSNGSLTSCSSDLAKKARKVLFAINSYSSGFGQLPVRVSCNLFATLVKPILTYNSEICYMDTYIQFYRAKLRANKNSSTPDAIHFIEKTVF